MQVIQFPAPEQIVQEQVVALLESALEMARNGDITSAVVITMDDSGESDSVGVMVASDGWVQTAGMIAAAQRAL